MGEIIQTNQIVFPITYFGSLGYFKELVKHKDVYLETCENFPKQTYRNRVNLNTANGIQSLSIPVIKPNGSKTVISDIHIDDSSKWRAEHWRTIKSGYSSAPYFDHYEQEIKDLIFTDTNSLIEFNITITKKILSWLGIEITLFKTDHFSPIQSNDFRIILADKKSFSQKYKASYIQVFELEQNFSDSISILDAILCIGPMARNILISRQS